MGVIKVFTMNHLSCRLIPGRLCLPAAAVHNRQLVAGSHDFVGVLMGHSLRSGDQREHFCLLVSVWSSLTNWRATRGLLIVSSPLLLFGVHIHEWETGGTNAKVGAPAGGSL